MKTMNKKQNPKQTLQYSNDLQIKSNKAGLFKYADDMVLVQLCSKSQLLSEQTYFKK